MAASEETTGLSYIFSHAMCAVPSLEAGNMAYEHLGFRVHVGGRHAIATQSCVVPLARGYLELISIYDEAAARSSPRRAKILDFITREGGGLIGFALRTDTMEADLERLHDFGLPYGGPVEAARTTPEGPILRWQVLRPTPQPCPAVLPILVAGDVATPSFSGNANTIVSAAGISLVSAEPARLVDDYRILLESEPVDQQARPGVDAVATVFDAGGFAIEVLEPTREGVAQRTLDRFGSAPVELQFVAEELDALAGEVGLSVCRDEVVIPPVLAAGVRMTVKAAAQSRVV